jgi:Zn-dependent proteases
VSWLATFRADDTGARTPTPAAPHPGQTELDKVASFLLFVPVLLFSMVAHEYAHGYAAFRQGDATAYQLGRLTWNPVKHVDPFMTILLPLFTYFVWGFAFGGAKPVPVNPRNYRNFKRGDIVVSLAGVATNFVVAVICTVLVVIIGVIGQRAAGALQELVLLQMMMVYGIFFNLLLAFFNLIPIPPLDGSHVVKYLLPPAWAMQYERAGRFGLLLVFAVVFFLPGLWLEPVVGASRMALRWAGPFLLPGVTGAL